jgi:DNA-directed RNA polymerase II subunit RPB1
MFFEQVDKWLRVICHQCGHSVYTETELKKFMPMSRRLEEVNKGTKQHGRTCPNCSAPQPLIPKRNKADASGKKEKHVRIAEYPGDEQKRLYSWHVNQIFSRVSNETVVMYGRKIESHPSKLVVIYIAIPSVTIRPDIKKIGSGGGKSSNDELTTQLHLILKKNNQLTSINYENIDIKTNNDIAEIQGDYDNYIKGKGAAGQTGGNRSKVVLPSIAMKLPRRGGRIREDIAGKRITLAGRTTIIGDPTLKIDQVGIPMNFARTLYIKDKVTIYNHQHLLKFYLNRKDRYPGCSKLVKNSDGITYIVTNLDPNYQLQIGDILYRDLIDGDVVYFNRQPSLRQSGIGAHYVVVSHDPEMRAFRMNVLACVLYDADFDGDQMNIYGIYSKYAINEARELGGLHNSMITYDHKQFLGQVQDSVVGLYLLTCDNVKMTKYRAMQLFSNTTFTPDFSDMTGGIDGGLASDLVSGREVISLAIPPINYKATASIYDKAYVEFNNYSPTEVNVEIVEGELISGVLDKKSIGAEVNGSLYHVITAEYGPEETLDVIFNHQQIACGFLNMYGLSTGIKDVILPPKGREQVKSAIAKVFAEADRINQMLINGTLVPPLGMNTTDFYEQLMMSVLDDDMIEAIIGNTSIVDNGIRKMTDSGSKGKFRNLVYMLGAVQQRNVADKRVELKFGFQRAGPYHMRGDLDPVHMGFIPVSYAGGQTSMYIIPDFMKTRKDLTDKSITVGESGDMNRNAVKNLDANVIDNLRRTMNGTKIVQQLVGHDGFDSRFQEKIKIASIKLADDALKAASIGGLPLTDVVSKSYKKILNDRNAFRDNFLRVERLGENRPMDNMVPLSVNMSRMYLNMITRYGEMHSSGKTLDTMLGVIDDFIADLPYVYSNEMQRAKKSPVEHRYVSAVRYLGMSIRWELRPKNITKLSPEILDLILQNSMVKIKNSLNDPGTAIGVNAAQNVSQPMTQGMLQSINKVGGAGKSTSVKSKEVMSARPLEKIKDPAMLIFLKDPTDLAKTKRVSNYIEVLKLSNFTLKAPELFLEEYGKPTHPNYIHEIKMFKEHDKYSSRSKPPGDLAKWCMRFELNKVTMLQKNMSMDTVIEALYDPNIFIVHSDQNNDNVIIRAYFRNSILRKGAGILDEVSVSVIGSSMMHTVIRGIHGVIRAEVVENINQTIITADGSLTSRSINAISTIGVNIRDTAMHLDIDASMLQTDSIDATAKHWGIAAAEKKIINEIRSMLDGLSYKHYLHYASVMTFNGRVTPMQRGGVAARDPSNVLLQVSHAAPVKVLETAAIHATNCKVIGVSGPIMVGGIPKIGSTYNQLVVNQEFVVNNKVSVDTLLDDM